MSISACNRLLAPLLWAALLGACAGDPSMVAERIDFGAVEGDLPRWRPGGHADTFIEDGRLVVPAGGRVSRPLEVEDYPIALRLTVEPLGTATGFLVVTRASNDTAGPYGLPRHGVVFAIWAQSRLEFNPWNAGVLWLDGDRLIAIARARLPMEGEVTMDIYDDGRWVLFAVDGEVLCATLTPDQALPENMVERSATQFIDALIPGEEPPSGGNVMLAAPHVLADAGGHAVVSDVALLRHAPEKSESMRARWESLVTWDQRRMTRAVHGRVVDARTGEPIPGVMIVEDTGQRQIFTDLDGRFLDSRMTAGNQAPHRFTLHHPDYPTLDLTIADSEDLGQMEPMLAREGRVELVLDLRIDPRARGFQVPVAVSLVPADGRRSRVNHTPPYEGPLLFRHLLPGDYCVAIRFKNVAEPHISEPFTLTNDPQQVHTLVVEP